MPPIARPLAVLIALATPVTAFGADQCKLKVAPPQTVFNERAINVLTRGDNIDAPISSYRWHGQDYWILPSAQQIGGKLFLTHSITTPPGTSGGDRVLRVLSQQKLFEDSKTAVTGLKGYKWITNTYQTKDGVLAFVHLEYTGKNDSWGMPCAIVQHKTRCAPGNSKIGLAWMDTRGKFDGTPKFKFLGHIAGHNPRVPHFNVSGTPYLINKVGGVEYLNIYFTDLNAVDEPMHVATARAPLADVLKAAKEGRTSPWKKFNNGAWEDALSARSTSVLPEMRWLVHKDRRVAFGRVIVHSDAVRHAETGRYFLSAYTNMLGKDKPSRIVLYDSCDGVRWRFNGMHNARTDGKAGWGYLSFRDGNGPDNGKASGKFELLAGFDTSKPGKSVVSMDIEVPASCACPRSAAAVAMTPERAERPAAKPVAVVPPAVKEPAAAKSAVKPAVSTPVAKPATAKSAAAVSPTPKPVVASPTANSGAGTAQAGKAVPAKADPNVKPAAKPASIKPKPASKAARLATPQARPPQ